MTILKIRDSDGQVMSSYPDMATAIADEEVGYTLTAIEDLEGDSFDPCWPSRVTGSDLTIDLEAVKTSQKQVISEARENSVLAQKTIPTSEYGTFYADNVTRGLVTGYILEMLVRDKMSLPPLESIRFQTVEGWRDYTSDEFLLAALELAQGVRDVFSDQETLQNLIEDQTTVEGVLNISWSSLEV